MAFAVRLHPIDTRSEELDLALQFSPSIAPGLTEKGLCWAAVETIFLYPDSPYPIPDFLPDCPPDVEKYRRRESRAAKHSLDALKARAFLLPSPWTGETVTTSRSHSFPWRQEFTSLYFVPLAYAMGQGKQKFYAVSCGVTGRIIHLYLPSLNIFIYEYDLARARLIDQALNELIENLDDDDAANHLPVFALVDMTTNHGHQMINHLSGLEKLVTEGLCNRVDGVLVRGTKFFGDMAGLFPEIPAKLFRYFKTLKDMSHFVNETPALVIRLGENHFSASLRRRILSRLVDAPGYASPTDRFPLIGVTLRAHDRRCVNLSEAIAHFYHEAAKIYPKIGLVLDGWCWPEDQLINRSAIATALHGGNANLVRPEFTQAQEIIEALPPQALVRNLIGCSMLQSIAGLLDIDAYFAHVGTLQHKIAFFSLAGGLVHGPAHQLAHIETGSFLNEAGIAPEFLSPSMVTDIEEPSARASYRISDLESCTQSMMAIIAAAQRRRNAAT